MGSRTETRRLIVLPLLMLASLAAVSAADAPLNLATATPPAHREATTTLPRRLLTRRDIFQAIENYLDQTGNDLRARLRPGDLRIQASVPVIKDDAGLEVKKISFDPLRRETVFEVWTSHQPQYLPFTVTTRGDPGSWSLSPPPQRNSNARQAEFRNDTPVIASGAKGAGSKLPVLARPGQPATLVMLGGNMRITTTVVPLQPGVKGQCILVRDATTARVMKAEVIDEGLLQVGL